MSNEKHCDLLLDYFNDQLTPEEQQMYEAHLQQCQDCQDELKELQELTEDLPYSSEPIEPPTEMKQRVLSNILQTNEQADPQKDIGGGPEKVPVRRRKSWYQPLIAAVLVLSLVGNGAALVYIKQDRDDNNKQEAKPKTSLDVVQRKATLQASEGVDSKATAMMIEQNEQLNLIVEASELPPLEGEETYQVWVLEDEKPYRAGTFVPNSDGLGAVSYVINYEGKHKWDTIAITKEPNAKSTTPQGDILLSTSL
ncbi:anti-sigma factor [Lentibacillus sp. N15]|uniref:anti-sigma factor n=1 Tax=Lentibacillus songyuanensis TaxID=3136161 RepID=UPI0031BADD29